MADRPPTRRGGSRSSEALPPAELAAPLEASPEHPSYQKTGEQDGDDVLLRLYVGSPSLAPALFFVLDFPSKLYIIPSHNCKPMRQNPEQDSPLLYPLSGRGPTLMPQHSEICTHESCRSLLCARRTCRNLYYWQHQIIGFCFHRKCKMEKYDGWLSSILHPRVHCGLPTGLACANSVNCVCFAQAMLCLLFYIWWWFMWNKLACCYAVCFALSYFFSSLYFFQCKHFT